MNASASEGAERLVAKTSLSHSTFLLEKVVYLSHLNTRENETVRFSILCYRFRGTNHHSAFFFLSFEFLVFSLKVLL